MAVCCARRAVRGARALCGGGLCERGRACVAVVRRGFLQREKPWPLTFRSLPQAGFTEPSYEEPTFKFTTFALIEELGTCLR